MAEALVLPWDPTPVTRIEQRQIIADRTVLRASHTERVREEERKGNSNSIGG
jgi:hypothetical protein